MVDISSKCHVIACSTLTTGTYAPHLRFSSNVEEIAHHFNVRLYYLRLLNSTRWCDLCWCCFCVFSRV